MLSLDRPPVDRPPLDRARLAPLTGPGGSFARVEVVATAPSTNTGLADAVRADPGAWPAPAVLVAEHQTAGRGRAGRTWQTPARAALTVSLLLRPAVPAVTLGWLPLLAGLAVVCALPDDAGRAVVKWPNDVLLPAPDAVAGLGRYRKVAGILAQVVPTVPAPSPAARPGARSAAHPAVRPGSSGPTAVVLGIGLNVSQDAAELPVDTATSLALAGASAGAGPDRTDLLVRLLGEVSSAVGRWEAADGDVASAGLEAECAAVSATLGTAVRAERAGGGDVVEGEAVRLDATGALVVRTADGERTVSAGDVHHLRW